MLYRMGIENNTDGRSIAWSLEHPGLFANGADEAAAAAAIPAAIQAYVDWVGARAGKETWVEGDPAEARVEESWTAYMLDESFELAEDGYEVNAWFRYDWKPLLPEEIERGLKLLSWTRGDLFDAVWDLRPEQLEHKYPGERRGIARILEHVGGSEWWYLDRLGLAFPREELSADPFERLDLVRARLVGMLPRLAGSTQVVGVEGEFWSPRKLLRRSVWHERDHVDHIRKLIGLHRNN